MSILIKSRSDIEKMRKAGSIAAKTLEVVGEKIRPSMTTKQLDTIIHDYIISCGATPTFLGYAGFPNSACISVNNEVIHGIPDNHHVIKEGDIVSVDVGATYDGFVGDTAYTFPVGKISDEAADLLRVTEESLYKGIEKAVVGARIGDIAHTIEEYCREKGYGVVREYCGHGVGRSMHEDPEVPNYGRAGHGARLIAGMTFCVEPMINVRGDEVRVLRDKWTVVTKSGSLSAHFEHEIAITPDGPLILTQP